MKNKPTREVIEIGKINFSGNIVPDAWFQSVKKGGKTNLNAVMILSEIVWWYRPQEIRDETTGNVIGFARKFKGELLQRSHQSFAAKFGITKKQSYDACKLLEQLGLIELILEKRVTLPNGEILGNVLYIRIFPENIARITHPLSPPSDRVQPPSDRVQPPSDRVQPPSDRVQPPSDRVQPPSDTLPLASGTYTEITTEITTEISVETTQIKEPLPSVAFVENNFLETPSDLEIEELRQVTLNPTSSEAAEAELASLKDLTLKTSVIKSADDVPRALAELCPALEKKEHTRHENDAFQMFWKLFREQWSVVNPDFPKSPGTKIAAAKAWDALYKGVKNTEPLAQTIVLGTNLYWEAKLKAGDRTVVSAPVFLSQGAWQEAIKVESKPDLCRASLGRYESFLTCWNQDRPMNWPEADREDLTQKSILRLEELASSCTNSLERFQKALHWAKRDPYWGLQRSQTLEEFLYSGRINEFYKKQLNAEANGVGDRPNVAPSKNIAADLRFAQKAKQVEQELRAEGLIP